jgi:transglutaminase-like putative cysteine protease
MDFSAWFEVYLDHRWYTFDARHNHPRIGRVLIGRGRDAVDVALTTAYGAARLNQMIVWADEIDEDAVTPERQATDEGVPPAGPGATGTEGAAASVHAAERQAVSGSATNTGTV